MGPLALLLIGGVAQAQEEVCGEFADWELEVMLDQADGEMIALNLPAAWRTLAETRKELRCLDTLIDPAHLARLAHGRAFLTWLDQQDEETATTWVRLARSMHAEVLLPIEPPPLYREFYGAVPDSELGTVDGGLAKVKRGAVFMDGYVLDRPEALVITPHFVQLVDKKGKRIDAWWQDGVAFHEDLLDDPGKDPPKWAVAMSPERGDVTVEQAEPTVVAEAPAEGSEQGWISEADEREWMPDCPWAGEEVKADAYGDTVVVNAQSWEVGSAQGASEFREVLGNCYAQRALRRFERWRAAKAQDVSVSSGSHDLDVLVTLVGDAGTAVAAEVNRVGLIKALEDPDRGE